MLPAADQSAMPQTQDKSTHEQRHKNNGQNGTPMATNPPQNQDIMLELRKYILLLASLVATVTYAAAFSPPGDVWQDTTADHLAGDPIIRNIHHKRYLAFFYCNATAFAASLVVIVLVLILASLDDKESSSNSWIVNQYKSHPRLAVRPLQLVMVVDLLSLMGAYAAGTCRDTFTTIYSSLLVGFVFFYVVVQVAVATGSGGVPERQVASVAGRTEAHHSGPGGVVPKLKEDEEGHPPVPDDVPASLASGNPNSGSSGSVPESEAIGKEEERPKVKKWFRKVQMVVAAFAPEPGNTKVQQDKAKERFRKVLLLLATFAVSITYSAGLSTPGGFWDSAGAGHGPGDAILKDRHNTRLAVFFGFNTLGFVASLLIIVVLLDTKLRKINAYGFIVVALVSLVGAYNAGSCRQTDTTVYVFSLIPAVLLYILFLYFVAHHIHAVWKAMKEHVRWLQEPPTPSIRNGRVDTNGRVVVDKTEKQKAADKARSLVLLLATLAATITYQAGLEPPGGVWQDNSGGHTAGDPILLTTNPRRYKAFFYCNSVSLVASLVAIVLAQKKLLLKHHVLEAVMILDLFGLIGAYAAGSCRDVNTSIHAMAMAGAVLVYVVIHVIFITLDDDTHTTTESDKKKGKGKGKDDVMELVEKTRKRLLLFAILAATITYQAGLTPPGGFLLKDDGQHHAGDPVLLYNFPRRYKAFFYCNSVSFMLSIALIILLVNPNLYRPAIRTHALSVCTAAGLFGLMGSYAAGSTQHLRTSVYVFVLIAVVLVCIALLFLVFLLTGGGSRAKAPGQDKDSSRDDTATTQGTATEADAEAINKEEKSNDNATAGAAQGAAISEPTNNNNEEEKKKREHANRKYLMVLGILVASVTYQAGLEPPGGAWQSSSGRYEAGNPVMHDNRRPRYLAFFYSNSTSFMASIVVILLLLIPPETLIGTDEKEQRRKKWLVVMNTTIVLDLLGLLGAYAAGSSRQWKTTVYVLLLVIGVLVYMAFHLLLSCTIIRRSRQNAQPLHGDSSVKPEANDTSLV